MTARTARRFTLAVCSVALVLAVALPSTSNAATGAGESYGPSTVLTALHVVRRDVGITTTVHWAGASGHVRETQLIDLDPTDERVVLDQWKSLLIGDGYPAALTHVNLNRNTALVAPDGSDLLDTDVMDVVWPFLARVRAGDASVFAFGGKGLLKATEHLGANECAGLRSGTRTVFVNAATFVPVRVIDKRGGKVERDTKFAVRAATKSDFAPLKITGKKMVSDEGYVRRTPSAAAKLLPFQVAMPTSLPAGFKLDHTGSSKRGATVGPEASFPTSNGLFFARWHRGLERIDLTIRGARSTLASDWDDSDPFGGECETTFLNKTIAIGNRTGHYTIGEERRPRMWWRDGTTLYTLTGAMSAEQNELGAIDEHVADQLMQSVLASLGTSANMTAQVGGHYG